jgi:hypothetical protein
VGFLGDPPLELVILPDRPTYFLGERFATTLGTHISINMHEAALKHCFRTVAQHLNQTFGEL